MTTTTTTTEIYWDTDGWAYRTRHRDAEGNDELTGASGPIDDERLVRALNALDAGEAPAAADLEVLRAEYLAAEFRDRNGQWVGELFPGWDQGAREPEADEADLGPVTHYQWVDGLPRSR